MLTFVPSFAGLTRALSARRPLPGFLASALLGLALVKGAALAQSPCSFTVVPTGQVASDSNALRSVIANAAAGQIISVKGGTYEGPIVIDKSITLIASPAATILHKYVPGGPGPGFPAPGSFPCLKLNGPGTGKVILAGFNIGSSAVLDNWSSGSDQAISGGGFDQLDIIRCAVNGPQWMNHDGVKVGISAMSVSVPLVVISHSTCQGGANEYSGALETYKLLPKNPTVVIATGQVILLDSTIMGTNGSPYSGTSLPSESTPCPCPSLNGSNVGGDAIEASTVYHVASTFAGGLGGKVYKNGMPWGEQPTGVGAPSSTATVAFPNVGIWAPGDMRIGQTWTLSSTWNTEFYIDFGLSTPWQLPAHMGGGWAFVMPPPQTPIPLTTNGLTVLWPNVCEWVGYELSFTAFDSLHGISRPVLDIFMP